MATLKLQIVTPDSISYSDDVNFVIIPGSEGELGILPEHMPLMTQIKPGELKITKGLEEVRLAVGEGFAEVTPERVSILTDMAIKESDIDEKAAEEAIARAEAALKEKHMGDEEVAMTQAILQKSLAQIRVKRRKG